MTMIRKLVQAAISTLGPDEVEITMSTAALVRDGTGFGHMTEALLLVITLGLRRRLGRAPNKRVLSDEGGELPFEVRNVILGPLDFLFGT